MLALDDLKQCADLDVGCWVESDIRGENNMKKRGIRGIIVVLLTSFAILTGIQTGSEVSQAAVQNANLAGAKSAIIQAYQRYQT